MNNKDLDSGCMDNSVESTNYFLVCPLYYIYITFAEIVFYLDTYLGVKKQIKLFCRCFTI